MGIPQINRQQCSAFIATVLLTFTTGVTANPVGENVVAGQAGFERVGSNLIITQGTQRVIINWQDFSNANGDLTKFIQPNSSAAALNRVVSGNLSSLLGDLEANGHIYLINPNGIVVGAGANINTQSFIASTLDVADADFMNGGDLNFVGDSQKTIENLGTINGGNGDVFLIAKHVDNSGTIKAEGHVGLAGANDVILKASGDERLNVRVTDKDGSVDQNGLIEATKIELKAANNNPYALAINHDGISRATSAVNKKGRIILSGGDKGEVRVAGTLDASAEEAGAAGGEVHVLGQKVGLFEDAKIDVSGEDAGTVLLGGDKKGQNDEIQNAEFAYVSEDAEIKADGGRNGDGGKVIVFAEDTATVLGSLSAKGGSESGDGGFIETSGLKGLHVENAPDTSATNGESGEWLIDPYNVTISYAGNSNISSSSPFTASASGANLSITTLLAGLGNGNVTITTAGGGTDAGNITIANEIDLSGTSGSNSLTLEAHNDININDSIKGSGVNKLQDLNLFADVDNDGVGDVNINSFGGAGPGLVRIGTLDIDVLGDINIDGNAQNVTITADTSFGSGGNVVINAGGGFNVGSVANKLDRDFEMVSARGGTGESVQIISDTFSLYADGDLKLIDGANINGVKEVRSSSSQTVDVNDVLLQGNGNAGAILRLTGAGSQTVNAETVTLLAGSGSFAIIDTQDAAATQTITTLGNVTLTAGTTQSASIVAAGNQTLDVTGDLQLNSNATAAATLSSGGVQDVGANSVLLNSTADLAVNDLNVTRGDVTATSVGDINVVGNLTANNSNVVLNSGGNINGAGQLSANNVTLNANSLNAAIGSVAQGINANATGIITANANNGNGGIFFSRQGDFDLSGLNFVLDTDTGLAELKAVNGNLITGATSFNFTGTNLTLTTTEDASNNTAGDRNIQIGTGGISATNTNITLTSADDVIVNGAINAASFTATAGDGKDGVGLIGLVGSPNPLNGRTGEQGERGGDISTTSNGTITTHTGDLTLTAGMGGNGANGETISDPAGDVGGNGGLSARGGAITIGGTLSAQQNLNLTSGAGGRGGQGGAGLSAAVDGNSGGAGSAGENGGAITINASLNAQHDLNVQAGAGGIGGRGGQGSRFTGANYIGGDGGNGGDGGTVVVNAALNAQQSLMVHAGSGSSGGVGGKALGGLADGTGDDGGSGGRGGNGGALTLNASLSSQQDLDAASGAGGTGGTGGDAVNTGLGREGEGGSGGNGGSFVIDSSISAQQNIVVTAGTFGLGGAGGIGTSFGGTFSNNGIPGLQGLSADINGEQIAVTSTNGSITVNGVINVGTDDVVINAGDQLTVSDLITANNISLTAAGTNAAIGTSGAAIQTNASGIINASAANGTGGIFISNQGDLQLGDINSGTGDAKLTAVDGLISTGTNLINFGGANLTLITTEDASNNTAGDRNIQIGTGGISGATTNITLTSADDVIIDGAITAASFTATAGDGKDGVGTFAAIDDPNPLNGGRTGMHGERGGDISITSNGSVITHGGDLTLTAGDGGRGAAGESSSVNVNGVNGDLFGTGGNSGGTGGNGGAGGAITINGALNSQQHLTLRAGVGGDGGLAGNGNGLGGDGGGNGMDASVFGGDGGNSGGSGGDGGAGGSLSVGAALSAQQSLTITAATGGLGGDGGLGLSLNAGGRGAVGGTGGGDGGNGGAGGSLSVGAALSAQQSLIMTAGTGREGGFGDGGPLSGDGDDGIAGAEGALTGSQIDATSSAGNVTVTGVITPDTDSSVSLSAFGALTLNPLQDINLTGAGNLFLQGFGFNSANNFSTVDGDISINSGNSDITLSGTVNSGNGDLSVTAGGFFNTSTLSGNDITLVHTGNPFTSGIQKDAGGTAVEIQATGKLNVNSTNGSGAIINQTGDLQIGTLTGGNAFGLSGGTSTIALTVQDGDLNLDNTSSITNYNNINFTAHNGSIDTGTASITVAFSEASPSVIHKGVMTLITTEDATNDTAGDHNITIGSGGINDGNITLSSTDDVVVNGAINSDGFSATSGNGAFGVFVSGQNGSDGERGGNININSSIQSNAGVINLTAGRGGDGSRTDVNGGVGGHGGAGGSIIVNGALTANQDLSQSSSGAITVNAGDGGRGSGSLDLGITTTAGNGGQGGDINITGDVTSNIDISLQSGDGQHGGEGSDISGVGGVGGSGGNIDVQGKLAAQQDINVTSGVGGDGGVGTINASTDGTGGNGGNAGNTTLQDTVTAQRHVNLLINTGGDGGDGRSGGGMVGFGTGGTGSNGGVMDLRGAISAQSDIQLIVSNAGDGGSGNVDGTDGSKGQIVGSVINATANTGALTLDGVINANSGVDVQLVAGTDLTLNTGAEINATGAGNIILAAGGNFHNDSGSNTPMGAPLASNPISVDTGRFLIYSTRPDNNRDDIGTDFNAISKNFVADYFVQYDTSFDINDPMSGSLPGGNGFVYSVQPVLTGVDVTVDDQNIAYGAVFDNTQFTFNSASGFAYEVDNMAIDIAEFELEAPTSLTAADIDLSLDSSIAFSNAGFVTAGTYTDGIEAVIASGSSFEGKGIALSGFGDLTVSKRDLNLTVVVDNKVYDATTDATFSIDSVAAGDLFTGDLVSIDAGTSIFDSKDVGTRTVTLVGESLSGADAGNYNLNITGSTLTADITKADLIVNNAAAQNKVYDRTTTAAITGAAVTALLTDTVNLNLDSANFDNKNVGTNKAVTANYSINGTDAGNYNLIQPTGLIADITQRTLNATLTADNKVYDRAITATGVFGDDRVGGDVLMVNNAGLNFLDKNVGTGKTVNAIGLSLSGTDAGNYVLAGTTANDTADITARTITASLVANDKVYDALTTATGLLNDDRIAGDVLTVSNTAINFADKNVGVGKTVTADGLSLSGTDAGNYVLAGATANDTADITARTITASLVANDKVYDALTTATGLLNDDRIAGDVLTVNNTAIDFADKNVGVGKTVTAGGLSLSGTDAGNYILAAVTANDTADVTARTLNANLTANDKVYDATTIATGLFGDDRIAGDVFAITGASNFDTKDVGANKTVTATGLSLAGTDAGNYVLASTSVNDLADVTQAALIALANDDSKVFDGVAYSGGNGVSYAGFVGGEDVSVLTGTANFSGTSQGATNPGGYSITPGGLTSANYDITFVDGGLTIDPATIGGGSGSNGDNGGSGGSGPNGTFNSFLSLVNEGINSLNTEGSNFVFLNAGSLANALFALRVAIGDDASDVPPLTFLSWAASRGFLEEDDE